MQDCFRSGEQILVRHVHCGRILIAVPVTVVADSGDLLVTWLAPGTPFLRPSPRIPVDWTLENRPWRPPGALQVTPAGAAHSIWLLRDDGNRFRGWYVNLQEPFRRRAHGIDTRDNVLDLWRVPGGGWRWKDEHELEEAVRLGAFSADEAAAIRAEAEHIVAVDPVPTGWEEWEPDPSWPVPTLPPGWDVV